MASAVVRMHSGSSQRAGRLWRISSYDDHPGGPAASRSRAGSEHFPAVRRAKAARLVEGFLLGGKIRWASSLGLASPHPGALPGTVSTSWPSVATQLLPFYLHSSNIQSAGNCQPRKTGEQALKECVWGGWRCLLCLVGFQELLALNLYPRSLGAQQTADLGIA